MTIVVVEVHVFVGNLASLLSIVVAHTLEEFVAGLLLFARWQHNNADDAI